MRSTIKTFDGHNINDASYQAAGLNLGIPASSTPVFMEMAGADAVYSGTFTRQVRNMALGVTVLDYSQRVELGEQLREWFKAGTEGTLVVRFSDEAFDYQIDCTVQSLIPDEYSPVDYIILLQSGASEWRAVTAETHVDWVPAASGETHDITVSGYGETRLSMTITPSSASSGGEIYQSLYQLPNSDKIAFGYYPWCIEMNTAALYSAGKMQIDCDDLRVFVDGEEMKRWIADPNTTTTNIWINLDMSIGYSLDLKTACASAGDIGELEFKSNTRSVKAIKKMPASGIIFHGTEWFIYSGKDIDNLKLGVVQRGALGTTAQAHAASDVFQFIQHVIHIVYGDATATDPADDDTDYDIDKPVFNLSTSSNLAWVYDATTVFYDEDTPNRPGSWRPSVTTFGGESYYYNLSQEAATGDPAMGLKMSCWQRAGRWQSESAVLDWTLTSPAKFSQIDMTGSKYRSTARWPEKCYLQRYDDDFLAWKLVFEETTPVSEDTWTAITKAAQAISNEASAVRFHLAKTLTAATDAAAWFEVLTATATFVTANMPTGTLKTEAGNYPANFVITNNTTGDVMTVALPMLMSKDLVLDGENFEATVDGSNCHGSIALDDNGREVWIRLNTGTNTIKVESTSLGAVSIDMEWYPRRQ